MPKCQICGKSLKLISHAHLSTHGLTHQEYIERFPDALIADEDFYARRGEKIRQSLDTPEVRQRRSERLKHQWAEGKMGISHSPEIRRKRGEASRDWWASRSEEEMQSISAQRSNTAKELWRNGVYDTKEYRQVLSESVTQFYQTPEGEKLRKEGRAEVMQQSIQGWWDNMSEEDREAFSQRRSDEMIERNKDPEYRKRVSDTLKQRWQEDEDLRERVARSRAKQAKRDEPSSIELILYKMLDDFGAKYETQVPVGKYITDALVENYLVIEADGNYWHSLPDVQERDEHKNKYMLEQGYQVLRFWGNELRESPDMCADRITYVLDCT